MRDGAELDRTFCPSSSWLISTRACLADRTSDNSPTFGGAPAPPPPANAAKELRRSLTHTPVIRAADPGALITGPATPQRHRGSFGARHDSDTELVAPGNADRGKEASRRNSVEGVGGEPPGEADGWSAGSRVHAFAAATLFVLGSIGGQ